MKWKKIITTVENNGSWKMLRHSKRILLYDFVFYFFFLCSLYSLIVLLWGIPWMFSDDAINQTTNSPLCCQCCTLWLSSLTIYTDDIAIIEQQQLSRRQQQQQQLRRPQGMVVVDWLLVWIQESEWKTRFLSVFTLRFCLSVCQLDGKWIL